MIYFIVWYLIEDIENYWPHFGNLTSQIFANFYMNANVDYINYTYYIRSDYHSNQTFKGAVYLFEG